MSERSIIEQCASTLAGLKTANLFSTSFSDSRSLLSDIRRFNRVLRGKGIYIVPIQILDGRALIYIYRPDRLERDLRHPKALRILKEHGYGVGLTPVKYLSELRKRLAGNESFPHEIGLFLGYPPDDVSSFIRTPKKGVKCVGCWKVYHNAHKAKKTFKKYELCTNCYKKSFEQGKTLDQLAVSAAAF